MSNKRLQIPFLNDVNKDRLEEISALLDKQEKHFIDIAPWPEFKDKPKVSFSIAHSKDAIFIKYDVTEKEVLARYKEINDPVYKDSCVEFFIDFDNDKAYYNIEFNRLGTCLGRFGADRENRAELPMDVLKTIKFERTLKQIKDSTEPAINWTLTVSVPIQVFCFHHFSSIQQVKCKMNFYKCGDDLSEPHYLAWNNIISEKPSFHLPEFFGEVEFM
ncbi:MAG: carbohydrate-binding family 9-like protein [Mucilaginibacter sp.]